MDKKSKPRRAWDARARLGLQLGERHCLDEGVACRAVFPIVVPYVTVLGARPHLPDCPLETFFQDLPLGI